MEHKTPFSKSFVVKTTMKHMKRSIEISISKSFDRLRDVDNESVLGKEIIETLSVLHVMKKMLDEFESNNTHLFQSK
jgi:hypothetical protein